MKRHSLLFFGVFFSLLCIAANISAQTSKVSNGAVLNDKATKLVKPDYPPAARAVNAGGTVNIEITIDEQGNVVSATAVSGHPLLKQVSEEAAKASKFSPTFLKGKPVKVTGILIYNFAATGKELTIKTPNVDIEDALNGQAVRLPSPEYPPAARAVNASGKVRVKVTLDEKGNVISATAFSGHPLLRQTAEKAAREAKFSADDIKNNKLATGGVLIYVFFSLPKAAEK
jgi:TonB family protein